LLVELYDRANRLLPDAHKRNRRIERLVQLLCEVEIKFDNVRRMVDDIKRQVQKRKCSLFRIALATLYQPRVLGAPKDAQAHEQQQQQQQQRQRQQQEELAYEVLDDRAKWRLPWDQLSSKSFQTRMARVMAALGYLSMTEYNKGTELSEAAFFSGVVDAIKEYLREANPNWATSRTRTEQIEDFAQAYIKFGFTTNVIRFFHQKDGSHYPAEDEIANFLAKNDEYLPPVTIHKVRVISNNDKKKVKRICSLKAALPNSREEMAHALVFDSPPPPNSLEILYATLDIRSVFNVVIPFLQRKGELPKELSRLEVKLSGDGLAYYSRSCTIWTISFTDAKHPQSLEATCPVVVGMIAEERPLLKEISEDLRTQIASLTHWNDIPVSWIVSADQKFLSIMYGLSGPRHSRFCQVCTVSKGETHLQLLHSNKVSCTLRKLRPSGSQRIDAAMGVEAQPLFGNLIPYSCVLFDPLHIEMRCIEKAVQTLANYCTQTSPTPSITIPELQQWLRGTLGQPTLALTRKKGHNNPTWGRLSLNGPSSFLIVLGFRESTDGPWSRDPTLVEWVRPLGEIFWKIRHDGERHITNEEIMALRETIRTTLISYNVAGGKIVNSFHILFSHLPDQMQARGTKLHETQQEGVEHLVQTIRTIGASLFKGNEVAKGPGMLLRKYYRRYLLDEPRNDKQCRHCKRSDHCRRSSKKCPAYKTARTSTSTSTTNEP